MIRHLLKMVWNRKRKNALIMLEIFLSFLALFALFTTAGYLLHNYTRPLGFEYENAWIVELGQMDDPSTEKPPTEQETMDQIHAVLKAQPDRNWHSCWRRPLRRKSNL